MNLPIENVSENLAFNLALDTLKIGKQALIFMGTKNGAEKLAEEIAVKIKTSDDALQKLAQEALESLPSPTKQCRRLNACLKKGIAFHHAGLTAKQRSLIEENFKKSVIKIICCTPTLAIGIDLPAYRSIIKDLRRYTQHGMAFIPVLEYLQMAGRAGRPSYDKEGQAIILAQTESEKEQLTEQYILGEPESIQSKLAVEPVLRTYILSLIASSIVSTRQEIFGFFEKTFWAYQFRDRKQLERKIGQMLELLEEWGFLQDTKKEFASADEIDEARFLATPMGKRVSELYLDPYTAHGFILAMQKASKKPLIDFCFLHMLSSTLEIRPLLRVKAKEYDAVNGIVNKFGTALYIQEPNLYDEEYDEYLNAIKTAQFLKEWIEEKDEEYLLESFSIRPGEIRSKIDLADWLCYCAIELGKLLEINHVVKELLKLRIRIQDGVKEELIPLLKLKGIGRVRARRLFKNGIKSIGDVAASDVVALGQILGKAIALDVKKQVGQDLEKEKVPENKRKGQISLGDY
ncbi:hypothetical protein HYU13_03115 [Candidatus Woesearchaeota archaeon]|nr:hypothetical protein [Candidatus Woesearchaeota archaeon]